jgi:hypothetical protein
MSQIELRREPQEGRTRIELLVDGEHASGLVVPDLLVRIGEVVVRCGVSAGCIPSHNTACGAMRAR